MDNFEIIASVKAASGAVVATIQQHAEKTSFGIEPGARLRVRITNPK